MTVVEHSNAPVEAAALPRERLGTGQIVTTVLAIFFRRLPKILFLAVPATAVIFVVFYVGFVELEVGSSSGRRRVGETLNTPFVPFIVAIGLGLALLAGSMATALDSFEKHGTVPLGRAFRGGLTRLPVAILQGLIVTAATLTPMMVLALGWNVRLGLIIGCCALVVGMYALGRWGLGLPCIALERAGLKGLRRSQSLGETYRWQIAGTCFLLFFAALLIGGLIGTGLMFGFLLIGTILREFFDVNISQIYQSEMVEMLAMLDLSFALAIILVVIALGLAAIRARLVEIKEPLDIEAMIPVFE